MSAREGAHGGARKLSPGAGTYSPQAEEVLSSAAAGLLSTLAGEAQPERGTLGRHAERKRARIAVLGASGYTGQEFARLSLAHPGLELAVLCSREHAGQPASALLPGLDPRVNGLPPIADPASLPALAEAGAFDTVVSCLPHGAWAALTEEQPILATRPARVVDLSSDHRDGRAHAAAPARPSTSAPARAQVPPSARGSARVARDGGSGSAAAPAGPKPAPGSGYVYGLPEAFRNAIARATRVANPGCYPTAAALALLPALEHGWIAGPVMVGALSGVSGAGRVPALRTSFVELQGGASLYGVGSVHPHVAEMERVFARLGGAPVAVGFAPQLAPMARGILLTASAPLAHPVTPAEARTTYRDRYEDEPFVHLLEPDRWPETRAVRASNRCDVAVTTLHGGHTLLVAAALDNLVKGAAGQAIQNLNLMLGWPEHWGLPVHGSPW